MNVHTDVRAGSPQDKFCHAEVLELQEKIDQLERAIYSARSSNPSYYSQSYPAWWYEDYDY